MGFDSFIAANNNVGKASNTCVYTKAGNKFVTYKTDADGVTTKYSNGLFKDAEAISTFEAVSDGTVVEYNCSSQCKVAEYKTDENGITNKYDVTGKKSDDIWWKTSPDGVTKEYNKAGEVVRTYKPTTDGVAEYNKLGNKISTYKECSDKEANDNCNIENNKSSFTDWFNNVIK